LVTAVMFVVIATEMVLALVVVLDTVPDRAPGLLLPSRAVTSARAMTTPLVSFTARYDRKIRAIKAAPAHFTQCIQNQVQKLISNAHLSAHLTKIAIC
jgi:hypothetical protein